MFAASSPARLRGLGLIALAAVSWGTTGSVTTLLVARAEATPLVVGAARMLVAAVLLLPAAGAWRRKRAGVTGGLWPGPRDPWRCLALGACMAAFQATYFTAVTHAGIAVTALVAICKDFFTRTPRKFPTVTHWDSPWDPLRDSWAHADGPGRPIASCDPCTEITRPRGS